MAADSTIATLRDAFRLDEAGEAITTTATKREDQ